MLSIRLPYHRLNNEALPVVRIMAGIDHYLKGNNAAAMSWLQQSQDNKGDEKH